MAYATGLFPLLVADQVGPDNELQDTHEGGANQEVCTIFGCSRREMPHKQVTKLGNADGLLIH